MIRRQITERRQLQLKMLHLLKRQRLELDGLRRDMSALLSHDRGEGLDLLIDHGQDAMAARQSERKQQASRKDETRPRRRRYRGRGRRRSMGNDPGPEEP